MKIAFICGSLEPGKDGVGDYTRKLAEELCKKGHECLAIALNDKFIKQCADFKDSTLNLTLTRIPFTFPEKERLKILEAVVYAFEADWISLQFVSFSFQPKGIISTPFIRVFKKISGDIKCHIMFHEIWVGIEQKAHLKHILWGRIQKARIVSLMKSVKFLLITTSNRLYYLKLSQVGIKPFILRLFSNIPIIKSTKVSLKPTSEVLIVFGGIHHGAPIEDFAKEVSDFSKKSGRAFELIIAGRSGSEQVKWQAAWERYQMPVKISGEIEESGISELLQSSTIGISTTPINLADKSGAVAAMRLHQLPIISVARDWLPRGHSVNNAIAPDDIFDYRGGNFETIYSNLQTSLGNNSVEEISKILIESMEETIWPV
ncbi:hypothetical protein MUY27_10985 [Mucilaginibacter sp. RS28]|uniref:Uncharacterized protein n=1 Tax=Mucilaginibacter straminoryzae TaxID=2932774 RepID=A0A9X1X2U9_9SPHI|nr:hypothetical protein [Mucilaginibacter straminoryzae]MCJ8210237.1 hypothetical protein [Mucilaginibacter straminoryzae]